MAYAGYYESGCQPIRGPDIGVIIPDESLKLPSCQNMSAFVSVGYGWLNLLYILPIDSNHRFYS